MSGVARRYTISSLDQLSLEGLSLDRTRLDNLPKNVYQELCQAVLEAVNAPAAKSYLPSIWERKPLCLHLEKGQLFFRAKDGVLNPQKSLPAVQFPTLQKAVAKTRDAARRRLPEAFRDTSSFTYRPSETRPLPEKGFWAPEASSILIDVNSVFRNSFSAGNRATSFIPISAAVGGALGLFVGINIGRRGIGNIIQAAQCGDAQGLAEALLFTGTGLSYTTVSAGMAFSSKTVAAPLGISGSATATLGNMANWTGLALYGLILANSLLSYHHIASFRGKLVDILDRKGVSTQEKAREGLLFLQQQISLTERDLEQLNGKSLKEYEKRRQEKWDRFVRRVGASCAQQVALRSAKLLERIQTGDQKAIQEAISLLEAVDKASHQQLISQIVLFVIAVLGIAASVVSITLSSAVASSALFAVGAVLWLLVDSSHVSNLFSDLTYARSSTMFKAL